MKHPLINSQTGGDVHLAGIPDVSQVADVGDAQGDAMSQPDGDAAWAGIAPDAEDLSPDAVDDGASERTGPGVCGCLLVLAPVGLVIWFVVIWFVLHQFR